MALQFEQETYKIIGACINVHKALGNGFLESVYQEALEKEFRKLQIPFVRHKKLPITFEGELLNKFFVADFVCYDSIILEIKAATFLHRSNFDQTINYLSATGLIVGLLVNFGESSLKWKRFIHTLHKSV
ncbi:MAG TPA: GxxExxY protein [Prolixibacteraceae bacterium]|jgi:GxxExxY protein|nr:GxxExxY protein [Prolixibacteraceae bacterium]